MKKIFALALVLGLGCKTGDNTPAQTGPAAEGKAAIVDGVRVGNRAPDFEVKDESGNTVKLSQHRGKQAVLLAFYPKDFTGG